jgi:hypothetical protein
MKIAITGHTSGIGKALFDYFFSYTPMGFSRSNGYNINHIENRKKIINQCADCDVFINNAYSNGINSQLYLLQEMHSAWVGKEKLIIKRLTIHLILKNFHINDLQLVPCQRLKFTGSTTLPQ